MWTSQDVTLARGSIHRITICSDGITLRYSDVIDLWLNSVSFRDYFRSLLADVSFSAYFWETPPITRHNVDRTFEFVVVDSAQLAKVTADSRAFEEYFVGAEVDEIVSFPSLGRDAVLVVPCPRAPANAYAHIAAFARLAPQAQQHALWRYVAGLLRQRLGEQPIWLSTSGLGVFWLHLRLDTHPKYYTFCEYAVSYTRNV